MTLRLVTGRGPSDTPAESSDPPETADSRGRTDARGAHLSEAELVRGCLRFLRMLERVMGTRAFAVAVEEIGNDKDYRERRWAAMPEARARMKRIAKELKADGLASGEVYATLTRPVSAKPLPPMP